MRKVLFIQLLLFYNLTLIFGQISCDFISKVQNYQKNIKLKLESGEIILDSSTFEIGTYLNLYDKLKIDSGKFCNIYYRPGILEGEPIIYIIPDTLDVSTYLRAKYQKIIKERPPLLHIIQDTVGLFESLRYDFFNNLKIRARNNITPENTELGLFQFLFFYVMGEQFALIGHSNYTQKEILCDKENIKNIIKRYSDNKMFKVSKKKLNFIQNLNPLPVINLDNLTCKITWYELWTHSGLYLRSYEIDRKPPFEIIELKTEELFNIDLNFNY